MIEHLTCCKHLFDIFEFFPFKNFISGFTGESSWENFIYQEVISVETTLKEQLRESYFCYNFLIKY